MSTVGNWLRKLEPWIANHFPGFYSKIKSHLDIVAFFATVFGVVLTMFAIATIVILLFHSPPAKADSYLFSRIGLKDSYAAYNIFCRDEPKSYIGTAEIGYQYESKPFRIYVVPVLFTFEAIAEQHGSCALKESDEGVFDGYGFNIALKFKL